MVSHPQYNLALRLAGVIFRLLLAIAPAAAGLLLIVSAIAPDLPSQIWLAHLLRWSLSTGAVGLFSLFLGSIWDAL